ncbi:LacI family transcriptional regulator [Limoniibacter endophyticus]|uniref:LacI family transcriptional regulator n=1 Tax=Limoniibacter endophyticus TaxID=1565040 RepID=A0A8J3DRT6_9HYPH|nr:LacI family transcriptional regulator [Limoniibacter endophyticus]GHC70607.1 LacI family transcriptional regulator [Limoniibacter endophyticus]
MERGAKKPTLRTIAEITGLAVTTVSRALADAPQIALDTRTRVRRVADEIGYLPDRAAQRLRTGRTNVISLILDPHDEILGFSTSIIRGLTKILRETRYNLVITPHFAEVPTLEPVQHILKNRMADGMIFSRTEPFDPRVKLLLENDFPFVSHGRTDFVSAHPYVDYDNERFAITAAKRLIEKGRKKLAIILPPERFTFCQHLRYGFMSVVRSEGVSFEIAEGVTLDSPASDVFAWAQARFVKGDAPDGFVCAGEVSALAILATAADNGLEIGRDIDIVSKSTSDISQLFRPRIDQINEPLDEAGELMGRFLLRRIAGESVEKLQHTQLPEPRFMTFHS